MNYPLSELVDRASIEKLKEERIPNYKSKFKRDALDYCISIVPDNRLGVLMNFFDELYDLNGEIWNLESDIRQGKEGLLGLEEVGRRAIAIRELNNKRIRVKNKIAERFGGYVEVKYNHASQ